MNKNFCSQCGGSLSQNAKFCSSCGHELNAHGTTTSATTNAQVQAIGGAAISGKPIFDYPQDERHSDIITTDSKSGEPIVAFRYLHKNAIWLFFMEYITKTSILLLLFALTIVIEPILTVALVAGYFASLYFAAKLNYNHYKFEITSRAFRKEHGIFHKYTVNIAFDQIQNINVRRSLIDQILGLSHIELETSGTGGTVKKNVGGLSTRSEGYIPGISPAEAKDIRTLMIMRLSKNK